MAAPLNSEEEQSSTRPPRFNGQFYYWWKNGYMTFLWLKIVNDGKLS